MSAPDIHAITARRVHCLPDDWEPRIYGCLDRSMGFYLVGAVPIGTFAKGPRKGKPKFPPRHHLRRVAITSEEVRETQEQWEHQTGLCHRCGGSGTIPTVVNRHGTVAERLCWCGGTGKAQHLQGEVADA